MSKYDEMSNEALADVLENQPGVSDNAMHAAGQRIRALAKFKAYVHQRFDAAGVPVDPDSPHKAEGCRVGGRLDWVFSEMTRMREELTDTDSTVELARVQEEKAAIAKAND